MIIDNEVNIYAATLLQDKTPGVFEVGARTVVVYLSPAAGETLTENDSFELRRLVAKSPQRTIKQFDRDRNAILLGANQPQFEVMIRGDYIVDKILNTTESVGANRVAGFEKLK